MNHVISLVIVCFALLETDVVSGSYYSSNSCKKPSIDGGYFLPAKESYNNYESITFYCKVSCPMVGYSNTERRCLNGNWVPNVAPPTCKCKSVSIDLSPGGYGGPSYGFPSYGCSRPNNPSYGEVHSYPNTKVRFSVGEYVSYQCNNGYTIQGIARVYCGARGWSHVPKCVRKSNCRRPADPSYGHVHSYPNTKQYFTIGDKITYQCNKGYSVYGGAKVTCGYSGWSHTPVCKRDYFCKRPSNPHYGEVHSYPNSKREFSVNEYVTYKCNTGYELHGNARVSCGHKGWGEPPKCVHSGCSSPSAPQYGYIVSPKSEYGSNDWVTYSCNKGYCMSGDGKSQCRYGKWFGKTTCKHGCGHRKEPSYGSYYGSKKSSWCPGDSARYQCNRRFKMIGHSTSTCKDDGSWTYNVPVCRKQCAKPSAPQYGYIVSSPPHKQTYLENDYIFYKCNNGYCRLGDEKVTCLHKGWSHSVICQAGCKHRSGPSYGSYYGNKKHWCPGDRARYRCNTGFRMYGDEYSTCFGGRWNSDVPKCRKICKRPSNPQYGYIVGSKQGYNEGDSLEYGCNEGYCSYGKSSCQHKGWVGSYKCNKGCGHRPGPSYGSYYGNKKHWCPGDRARYRCNTGFRMYGNEYATCSGGKWGSDVPKCRKICKRPSDPQYGYVVGYKQLYNEGDPLEYGCNKGYCSYGKSSCQHKGWVGSYKCNKGCGHRPGPSYGSYYGNKKHWCPGDRARYRCNTGFRMYGNEYATCSGGKWGSDVPKCRKICKRPSNPQYGYIVGSKQLYNEGDSLEYGCNNGYCSYGKSSCQHKGWVGSYKCNKGCGHRPGPSYGSYYGNKKHWCPGDRARYRCNTGFRMYGNEYATCSGGRWGSDVPKCRKICKRPSDPQYGYVVGYKQLYNEGDSLEYGCNKGYCSYGKSSCQHKGWVGSYKCNKGCGHRPGPSYGSYYGNKKHWCPGDRARYRCNTGFRMYGNEYATCSGGKWGSDVPKCRKICKRPSNPQYGYIVGSKRLYNEGDSLEYGCNNGYCSYGKSSCQHKGWVGSYKCNKGCGHRPGPSYGSYYGNKKHWCPGDRARYRCNTGFRMYGDEYATCSGGRWGSDVPKCRKICKRPSDPQYGYVVGYKQLYNEGDSLEYGCNEGYCSYGKSSCQHKGWVGSYKCNKGCGHRPGPSYGSYYGNKKHWCPGDRARYKCNHGFRMYGNEYATCSGGRWGSDVPKCRKICERPSKPQYGYIVGSKRLYNEGDPLEYGCNKGYCSYGKSSCQHKGWVGSYKCNKGCGHRPGPSYGSYYGSKKHWCPGDRARYRCNTGFRMYGNEYATCSGGRWGSDVPKCRKLCKLPSSPQYGYIVDPKDTYEEDKSIRYGCNPGYCLSGKAVAYCRHKGWEKGPTCVKGCGHRKGPSYGSYYGNNKHWCPGDRARYKCNTGFRMYGDEYSQCGSNGWGTSVPVCKKLCKLPVSPHYGYIVDPKTAYEEGKSIRYGCNPGYCLSGKDVAYCRHKGWEKAPTCVKGCGFRKGPSYGSYYGSKKQWCPGERARFRCNNGFFMKGDEYSMCGYDGSWRNRVPECKKICKRPSNPQYGYVVGNKQTYKEKEHASYRCNIGYCLEGSANVYCEHSGWAKAPRCIKGCTHRSGPSYGSYYGTKKHWCPGDRARYQCNPSFHMDGSEYAICGRDYKWASPVPKCSKICRRPSDIKNGYIVTIPRFKRTFKEGEFVSYHCSSGFCRQGGEKGYCRHNGWVGKASCRVGCELGKGPSNGGYYGNQRSWCPGEKARFRCNYGFQMYGSEWATCTSKFAWDKPMPKCKRVCHLPNPPAYGSVHSNPSNKKKFAIDEWVIVRCNKGYTLHGQSSVYCKDSGWTQMPSCRYTAPPTVHTYRHGGSCVGKCGSPNAGGCSCDSQCSQRQYGDCCDDYEEACNNSYRGGGGYGWR